MCIRDRGCPALAPAAKNAERYFASVSYTHLDVYKRQVQGTINGYGERCGNADLCSIIPNLELKMQRACLPSGRLKHLSEVSHYIAEIANMPHHNNQPFVGYGAFAHKGGIHVSCLLYTSRCV